MMLSLHPVYRVARIADISAHTASNQLVDFAMRKLSLNAGGAYK
jgi:hypothetical protein